MIVTADLLKTIDSNKVIPIIHQNGSHDVPNFLRTKMFLDFSRQDQYEFSFDELIRTLHNSPLYEKLPVANNPFVPVSETPPNRTGDGVLTVMSIIATLFESEYGRRISYKKLVLQASMSRIILDLYIDEAKSLELIELDPLGDIILTTRGKHYIVKHKLINDQMNSINT